MKCIVCQGFWKSSQKSHDYSSSKYVLHQDNAKRLLRTVQYHSSLLVPIAIYNWYLPSHTSYWQTGIILALLRSHYTCRKRTQRLRGYASLAETCTECIFSFPHPTFVDSLCSGSRWKAHSLPKYSLILKALKNKLWASTPDLVKIYLAAKIKYPYFPRFSTSLRKILNIAVSELA